MLAGLSKNITHIGFVVRELAGKRPLGRHGRRQDII